MAVWLVSTLPSSAHASTLVCGENRTCRDYADLDYALDHPNSLYFKGWTTTDFDAAQSWVESCAASPPSRQDQERQSLLLQRRASLESRGEIQRNTEAIQSMRDNELRDQQSQEAELRAQEAARQAEEAKAKRQAQLSIESRRQAERIAKQAAYDECLRTQAYQRYVAGTHAVNALDRAVQAQQSLEHEKQVEDVSETTDLYAKHFAGESLVTSQEDVLRLQPDLATASSILRCSRETATFCTKSTRPPMENVAEIVALLRKQAQLEATRRRLAAYPQALNAVLLTARALGRQPDAVSVEEVTKFGWAN